MEKQIIIAENDNLESIVYTLLASRARGEQAFCIFNGIKLDSISVSMESAYMDVMGCTKEEYEKRQMEEWLERLRKEDYEF